MSQTIRDVTPDKRMKIARNMKKAWREELWGGVHGRVL